LRERRSDVPRLAAHFLEQAARKYGRDPIELTRGATAWLHRHPWPGNVRQLGQALERAVLVVDRTNLSADDLEALARLESPGERHAGLPRPGSMTLDEIERAMIVNCMRHYEGNVTHTAEALGLSRAALYRRLEKHGIPHDG